MKTTIRIKTPIFGLPAGTVIEALRKMDYDRPGWAEFIDVTGNCQCAKLTLPETHFEEVNFNEGLYLKSVELLKNGGTEAPSVFRTRGNPMFIGNEEADSL